MSLINMENGVGTGSGGGSSWEQNRLISELTQGREMAQQLQNHFINTPASSSSQETSHLLLRGIVSSYEKALSMLNIPVAPSPGLIMSESPPSLFGSPRSDQDSDQDPRDGSTTSRKRKSIPRWTQQVRVSPGMGLEGPLDDGFSWRKYGQKDILGAKYPRGYYRCTHRNVQGCLATKQVQRSDEDPTIFEITYRGRHTCTHASSTSHLIQPPSPEQRQLPEPSNTINNVNDQSQEMLLSFRTGLKVRTQDLDTTHQKHQQQQQIPSFPFPKHSSNNNSSSSYMGMSLSQTTSFVSPATSGSNNYFSPTSGLNGSFGGNRNYFHSQESELTHEIISAATSSTNSPTINLDFPFGPMDFDPNFCFGNQGFFSGN